MKDPGLTRGIVGRGAAALGVLGMAAAVMAVEACGPSAVATSPTPTSSVGIASSPAPAATSAASVAASPPDAPASSPAPSSSAGGGPIVVDPALLELLPAAVAGVPLTADVETAAELARDPVLAESLEALGLAAAFGPPSTDAIGDYVVTTVARLRPGVFDDGFFRGWRDSFDEAVCAQAGGVASGRSELEIAGHQTFRRACVGGVVTYHTYLADRNVIVSLQGIGPAEFGRQVIEGLTE
ncbi:MAG TPA: hypothetical protein VD763_06290 [Candidatus Saccharimonadales bacterium]|nr:hypothetical protein [Candidatus Saccharimonadales bacterium]